MLCCAVPFCAVPCCGVLVGSVHPSKECYYMRQQLLYSSSTSSVSAMIQYGSDMVRL